MSWFLLLSVIVLLAAIVLIELRAVRAGDERRHHAPGYAFVMGGLVLIGFGIAAALTDDGDIAVLLSLAGLISVVLGSIRHDQVAAH